MQAIFVKALLALSIFCWVGWVILYYYIASHARNYYIASHARRAPDLSSDLIYSFNYKGTTLYVTFLESWLDTVLFYGAIVAFVIGAYLNKRWNVLRRP